MGRVRTKTVKRAAKTLIEHYFSKLTNDFHFNKKILSEVAQVPSKRLRNKIAGFATHLMKRIQKGPVRGISLKVQEEERERRLDFVPEKSIIDLEKVTIDNETREMLKKAGLLGQLGVLASAQVAQSHPKRERGERGQRGERGERGERAPRAPKEEQATPKPAE